MNITVNKCHGYEPAVSCEWQVVSSGLGTVKYLDWIPATNGKPVFVIYVRADKVFSCIY